MRPVWVINAVGLVRSHLGSAMPATTRWAGDCQVIDLDPALPAVTTTAQTSMLTGVDPTQHGIVGNGWYFRDQGEVWLWRQSERLVQAALPWSAAGAPAGFSALKHCWWYAMHSACTATVTPRPVYHHDGRKSPDCYAWPPELKTLLDQRHGTFPLFQFWGPGAGIASSRWIAESFVTATTLLRPQLALCYLPHLDYDLQRFGPVGAHLDRNLRELDGCMATILDAARSAQARVIVVSEYGIGAVKHALYPNRLLREHGLLTVTRNAAGELIDYAMSRAFAVVDHQCMHVYVRDVGDIGTVRTLLRGCAGIAEIAAGDERAAFGLAHPRSGEVIAFAEQGCWFAHDWWRSASEAPDFARCVEIHKKPGYDPRELLFDPRGGKRRAALALLKKKLGMRYVMDCIASDDRLIGGSHGRPPTAAERPLLMAPRDLPCTEVRHHRDVRRVIDAALHAPAGDT